MEVVKITKKMLKMHPADLLIKLSLISPDRKLAFPELVWFSKEDYKELRNNLKKYARKTNPRSPERLINYSVGVDLLNFGPNQSFGKAIKPGWALVDREDTRIKR